MGQAEGASGGGGVVVERRPDALWRRCGDVVLVVTPPAVEVQRLAGSAAALWVVLDRPATLDEVRVRVDDLLVVADGVDRAGIEAAVAMLETEGLVRVTGGLP